MNLSSSAPPSAALRRTRFVCISDTHNSQVKLPRGDVLVHAGDLTNQGGYSELSKTISWLEKADFEAKIVIAGNHDVTLDEAFFSEYGAYFHNEPPQSSASCISLLMSSSTITYLNHESATIRLSRADGPHTVFKVFGSPYSPRNGMWAFGYDGLGASPSVSPSSLSTSAGQPPTSRPGVPGVALTCGPPAESFWEAVPLDADVVVTHTPARTHCDECQGSSSNSTGRRGAAGCEALRRQLWRVRPRLAVCGHVHEGRGAERVLWDILGEPGTRHCPFLEKCIRRWEDPGTGPANQKLSLVDLTARGGKAALDNDGSHPGRGGPGVVTEKSIVIETRGDLIPMEEDTSGSGTRGLGGDPETDRRCDRTALLGRLGRKETCVVNCAIMANSYPHTRGRQLNKPIVVDLDLPVWDDME